VAGFAYAPPPAVGNSASLPARAVMATTPAVPLGAPVATSMSTTSAAAPPMSASVSALPQVQQVMVQQVQQVARGPPVAPRALTEGMPDPASVEQQKAAYARSLDAQLKERSEAVAKRSQMEKEMLRQQAAQQKAQFNLQIDQQLQATAMALDEQTNAQMLALQEAAVQQKSALESQAAGLKLEYEQRKAQEDMMIRQYEIQKQYYEAQQKMLSQLPSLYPGLPPSAVPGANPGAPPPGTVAMPPGAVAMPVMPGAPAGSGVYQPAQAPRPPTASAPAALQ